MYSKEVDVPSGASVSLTEDQLQITGNERLAMKDAAPIQLAHTSTASRRSADRAACRRRRQHRHAALVRVGSLRHERRPQREARAFLREHVLLHLRDHRSPLLVPRARLRLPHRDRWGVRGDPTRRTDVIGFSSIRADRTVDAGFATRTWLGPTFSLILECVGEPRVRDQDSGRTGLVRSRRFARLARNVRLHGKRRRARHSGSRRRRLRLRAPPRIEGRR